MMGAAADQPAIPLQSASGSSGKNRKMRFTGRLTFTTSGAVDATNSDHASGVSATKPEGTGLYYLTFPASKRLMVQLTYWDTSGGAVGIVGKSILASTGVVYFTTTDGAGSAADAASGDYVTYDAEADV